MTFNELLNEVFVDYAKAFGSGTTHGIWKNPTKAELSILIKEEKPEEGFRFFIDFQNEDVYVFNSELLHGIAIRKVLGLKVSTSKIVKGFANSNGKIEDEKAFEKSISKKFYDKALKIIKKGNLYI